MEAVTQQIPPGEQIGPYQVVRRLGAGGMGEVYLARHRHLNRDAAVKVLLAEISMNQTVVARFFTEARATAQLRHPNIVEIFDCDVLPDGRAYIVMEYLRGESLRTTLDRTGKLAPDYGSVAAIAGMVADALQAAHENGIVHRDLKPDNTFLTVLPSQKDELTVKVLDFGIAKLLSGGDKTGSGSTPTRTGSLIGTPLYMSPEQCRGIPTIDHRADIYSLGCVMFEMVVGQPPFVSEAPGDILMAHIMQPAPSLLSFAPDVPPGIEALVARMLAKDPAGRPQSMAEIVAAIEALVGMRKNELGTVLRRPVGFADATAQVATQILAPDEASGRLTPGQPRREGAGAVAPTTPLVAGQPSRPKPTPVGHVATPLRPKPDTAGRGKAPGLDGPPTKDPLAPNKPKWLLPVAVIASVVAIGGVTTYLLTRPDPDAAAGRVESAAGETPGKAAELAPPAEIEVEITSAPERATVWVVGEDSSRGSTPTKLTFPKSLSTIEMLIKAPGYVDKRLTIDGSRDRTIDVDLDPVEPVRPRDDTPVVQKVDKVEKTANPGTKAGKKKGGKGGEGKGESGSKTETSPGTIFKAVGD